MASRTPRTLPTTRPLTNLGDSAAGANGRSGQVLHDQHPRRLPTASSSRTPKNAQRPLARSADRVALPPEPERRASGRWAGRRVAVRAQEPDAPFGPPVLSAGTERLGRRTYRTPSVRVSLAALYRPVSCRIGLADSCRGSPCRACAAPRSAAPLHPDPRREMACRSRRKASSFTGWTESSKTFPNKAPPYSRGMRCDLLPTGTRRSLRDIAHWQPARGRIPVRLPASQGPGGDPNAAALATPPGPSRTYGMSAGGASGGSGQVLYDRHRHRITAIVSAGWLVVDSID